MTEFSFEIENAPPKQRLDRFLYAKIGTLSRMFLRGRLAAGACLVNGAPQPAGYHLRAGDRVEIKIEMSIETAMTPEPIALEILFEDEELLVIDKPAEMLVHPTKGVRTGTLLNALSHHLNHLKTGGEFVRPGLIHRLDKKTSGLMVVAKTARAHRILSDHFQRRLVEKRYFAVVEGVLEADAGEIRAPIGRDAEARLWGISAGGKPAESRWRAIEKYADSTLLELEPVTGRTNQLRLHLAHIGHPIVGDDLYGGRRFGRLCLHAARLCFWHPDGNRRMDFETPVPADFFNEPRRLK